MSLERIELGADPAFWDRAAAAVLGFAAGHAPAPATDRQLQWLTWVVPEGKHVALARTAVRAVLGPAALIPPRVVPLHAWLPGPLGSGVAARAEIYGALRANRWARAAFSEQPASLWALAGELLQLSDELTIAAAADPDAFAGELQACLERHFRGRASRPLQPQARLALQVWHARRNAGDGAAALLRALDARAAQARAPLIITAPLAGAPPWLQAFAARYAQQAPLLMIIPDPATAVRNDPLLAAAWPELVGDAAPPALAQRADAVAAAPRSPFKVICATTLEDEASAVSQQVIDWLGAGRQSIGLIALDRLTARRVRALLERAQVLVDDETGWKLSTTSAASVVMRWLDVAADDLYWRDLIDWLKSSFSLAHLSDKDSVVNAIDDAIRRCGALQGAQAIARALTERNAPRAANDVVALIDSQARVLRRPAPSFAALLRSLQNALDALGMRPALVRDTVGREVLAQIELLQTELGDVAGGGRLADLRAALAARFEEVNFIDRGVESPVSMISLTSSGLRNFDAVFVIGADAAHLPAAPHERLFVPDAVRAELGLATADEELRRQAAAFAVLAANAPQLVASWRSCHGDEPNALSPLLERLRFVVERAGRSSMGSLIEAADPPRHPVHGVGTPRPAPAAPALLPSRVSASQAQSLVNCAYQFYARAMLGLRERDDVIEVPDKRDFGEALHAVLWRFHGAWGAVDFSAHPAQQIAADLRSHAEAVFTTLIAQAPAMLAYQRRFEGLIDGYVDWLQRHAREGWRWRAGEERRDHALALERGATVMLTGRVDRVDENAAGELLVIDYKARAVNALRRGLKDGGEDVQLPFYGLLLGGRVDQGAYLAFDRRKEDDPGVREVSLADLPSHVEQLAGRMRGDLQRIADGAPLPALGVATVCSFCEMRGLCRRDYWERDAAADADVDADALSELLR